MKILVYPKDPNPYQNLLYKNLSKKAQITYLKPIMNYYIFGTVFFPVQLLWYRIHGYKILHLHWTYDFSFPINNIITRTISTIYFLLLLFWIKLLCYKLIWTVHNVLPMNKRFIFETEIRKILSRLCNAKIAHSQFTIDKMKELTINISNTYIIPHGNYINNYENKSTKSQSRKLLKINKNDFTYLFFGNIDPYKGVTMLLNNFAKLIKQNNNLKLIVAGKCKNAKLMDTFNNYNKFNYLFKPRFINNDEIQYYFNSCDVVVYPADNITSSGSILLALSFGKPIIYPLIGNLREIPYNVGFPYNNSNNNGLYIAMANALKNKNKLKKVGNQAFNYAKTLSWKTIANKTYKLYNDL